MKRAERQPRGGAHLYGGVFVKEMIVEDPGTLIPQHAHTYDHLSYLARGWVEVYRGEELLGVHVGPCAIRIPARQKHMFRTMSHNVLILCIHNAAHGEAADIHEEHHLELEG